MKLQSNLIDFIYCADNIKAKLLCYLYKSNKYKILLIENDKDFKRFNKIFNSNNIVDWLKLTKLYAGIAINNTKAELLCFLYNNT